MTLKFLKLPFCFALLLLLGACGDSNPLLGKWQKLGGEEDMITFTPEGVTIFNGDERVRVRALYQQDSEKQWLVNAGQGLVQVEILNKDTIMSDMGSGLPKSTFIRLLSAKDAETELLRLDEEDRARMLKAAEEEKMRLAKAKEEDKARELKAAEDAKLAAAEAAERQERKAEEDRLYQEREAERKRLIAERRAARSEFIFSGFTLADSPQQLIGKGLEGYAISTSFPVQQSGKAIRVDARRQNLGEFLGGSGMYANGRGVAKDEKQALAWYLKAAEQKHAEAQNNLKLASGSGSTNHPKIADTGKIRTDIVGRNTGEGILSWEFSKDHQQEITIIQTEYSGDKATVIIDMKTSKAAGYSSRTQMEGKLRLHYEWVAGDWTLIRVENLDFKKVS